ncbi:class I SAM-dependent methyltransferase, partial [Elstera litoralis]|uniref:class I SAM-dependent methyltransferase n=1 Tax=Elstera litoralis TaxID=552518 RepID=UPI0012EDA9B4
MSELSEFYASAEAYDLAFSYRNIDKEVAFLRSAYERYARNTNTGKPHSVLELASGPGKHAMAFARAECHAVAIDLSPAMCQYGERIAKKSNLNVQYIPENIINFRVNKKFDLAIMMLDSICHITNKHDLVRHLFSVAVSLNPGGLYIIEAGHNDNNMNTTKSEWEIITDNSHIGVSWRDIRRYKYDRILTEATLRGFIREIKINNVDTFIRRA